MKSAFLFGAFTLVLTLHDVQSGRFKNLYKGSNIRIEPSLNADPGEPLLITPYLKDGRYKEAQKAALVQHSAFANVVSYSAYFTVDETYNSNLWFWYFPSAGNVTTDPVVLWLNGGPGATSLYGLFDELGPFIVDKSQTVSLREYSWHHISSIIFIDNPAGVGFSFTNGGLARNETKVGQDMYTALVQFMQLFPELQQNDFFLSGESYAGKYLSAIGYTIHTKNPTAKLKINLKGIMIGDGWTDPRNQMNYSPFLYNTGLISVEATKTIDSLRDLAVAAIDAEDWDKANLYAGRQFEVIMNTIKSVNVYNIIDPIDVPEDFVNFLNTDEMRSVIHVGSTEWGDKGAGEALDDDEQQSVAPWLEVLLNNYRVLIYTGQLDLICGYRMSLDYVQKLSFDGAGKYDANARNPWYVDDDLAGYVRTGGNLVELLVRNAGHMVPRDQPKWSYDMMYKFTRNQTFS